jgi:thioredoxin 1
VNTEKIVDVTSEENFIEVTNQNSLSVVDFYADWCGPCNAIKPAFEQLANDMHLVRFYKLNIDEVYGKQIAQKYNVMSIPTFMVFNNGGRLASFHSIPEVKKFLQKEEN